MISALRGPAGAVLIGAFLLFLGNGMQGLALPLRGVAEGFDAAALGLLGSAYSGGFILGCLLCPRIIRRVGHIRAFSLFAALAAGMPLFHVLVVSEPTWVLFRFGTGAGLAGLFMVIESWLNDSADNKSRGSILGIYLVINYAAMTVGQLAAAAGDPLSFVPFALAAIAIGYALMPIAFTSSQSPAPPDQVSLRVWRILKLSPVGGVGALLVGFANGAFATLAPVFADARGFTTVETALFVSASIAGAAAMQIPAGWVSDRMDRRIVICTLAAIAAAMGLWLTFSDVSGLALYAADIMGVSVPTAWVAAGALFGAAIYPIYGLCVAHLNDFVDRKDFVEAAGSVLLLWSIGAVVGPLVAGAAMSVTAPRSLFTCMAVAHILLALFALWRMTRRAAPKGDEKDTYVPTGLVRTAPTANVLDPRAEVQEQASPPQAERTAANGDGAA